VRGLNENVRKVAEFTKGIATRVAALEAANRP